MDKTLRETQQMNKLYEKRPLHQIKGFLEINFYEASWGGSLLAIMPEKLLSQIDVIYYIPSSKESILSWTDNVLEGTTESYSKNLGDHFVDHIAACDRPKIIGIVNISRF
jgi:hypothetical protein